MRQRLIAALLSVAALLAGCSTTRVVDADAQAFSSLQPSAEPRSFRFERLPSQQAQPQQQAQLEAIAQAALERAGLRHDPQSPRYSVQVDTQVQRLPRRDDLWGDPWHRPWGLGPGWGAPGWHHPGGSPLFWGPHRPWPEPDWLAHRVQLVLRDLHSQQIVFESQATHEARQPADAATWGALFDAALQGFPTPPCRPAPAAGRAGCAHHHSRQALNPCKNRPA